MSTTRVPGVFGLIHLVYNTINKPVDHDRQVACFRNAAAHLAPGSRFVVARFEAEVGRLASRDRPLGQHHCEGYGMVEECDRAKQIVWSHSHFDVGGSWHQHSAPYRYVWPPDLDVMAHLAGLEREPRWADWERRPFTESSPPHVSV